MTSDLELLKRGVGIGVMDRRLVICGLVNWGLEIGEMRIGVG